MALWKDNTAPRQTPAPAPENMESVRYEAPSKLELAPSPAPTPVARPDTGLPRKESLIAADLTIEGKIEGGGSVRADKVTIAGELEGNVQDASRVDLLATGAVIGDLKAGSVTVAAGARMRGKAEFGWDEGESSKTGKHNYSAETGAPL